MNITENKKPQQESASIFRTLIQPYPISPHAYFANLAKYSEMNPNNLVCEVCGDISSGKHYGILSCNGCSGFFKRSVRRKLIYRCQANTGRCFIDKTHRNQCQACRLKKCLQMGMIKEAVQNQRQSRIQISSSSIEKHNGNLDETVYSTSSQILLMIIKWIHNIPTFRNISHHDQLILLEESWAELFLLWAIQYSISSICENEELIKNIFHIFKQLKLDSIEFDCLKAIILFRSDNRTLNESKIIENFQDQAQLTLAQFTQIQRFGRLLLTLPLLRSIPSIMIEKTFFSRSISVLQLL